VAESDHARVAAEEHLEGDARKAFLAKSTEHHSVAGALNTHGRVPMLSLCQGRTGSHGSLAFARWAGWFGVQLGRHVK